MNPIKYLWEYIKNDWKSQDKKGKIFTIIAILLMILFMSFLCWAGFCSRNFSSGGFS